MPLPWREGCLVVTTATPSPSIQCLFDGLAPPEVIEAYDRLLVQNGCAKSDAEAMLGAGLVRALTERGMAHIQPHTPADPAWLRPISADLALQGILAGHQSQLAADHQRLLDGHERLAEAQAHFGIGMNGYFPEHLGAVVSDPAQISELSASLIPLDFRNRWLSVFNAVASTPYSVARSRVRIPSVPPHDPSAGHIGRTLWLRPPTGLLWCT
jgi:hypothetical protein